MAIVKALPIGAIFIVVIEHFLEIQPRIREFVFQRNPEVWKAFTHSARPGFIVTTLPAPMQADQIVPRPTSKLVFVWNGDSMLPTAQKIDLDEVYLTLKQFPLLRQVEIMSLTTM